MSFFGPPGYVSVPLDVTYTALRGNYEFKTGYDCGKTFLTTVDGIVVNFTPLVPGNVVCFYIGGPHGLELIPHHEDGIMYKGHGIKGLSMVNMSRKAGDYIKLASLNGDPNSLGTKLWHVIDARGNWLKK